ncbi:hypothetical protein FNV43_RR24654 [Rhamnella rubrinervis]|uniref:Uncharacterized protein n=1 Tax=Rhamnella rubrinervis TaxID=2594499 RepID=A0A8K0DYI2_9ROSA|nr:hypothetical protein FNV43_RR24654 [Rhamnella rubrinervis]
MVISLMEAAAAGHHLELRCHDFVFMACGQGALLDLARTLLQLSWACLSIELAGSQSCHVVNGITPSQKAVVGGNNYASALLSGSQFDSTQMEYWHPRILTDLTRGIGIPLRIDNSSLAGNYDHYARVLVDVDLTWFVPEKLLLEMIVDCIEVDLYFESFSDFYTFCHSVGHPVAKGNWHPLHVEPSTHYVPTSNAFEVLNTVVIPTHIEDTTHQPTSLDLGVAPSRIDFDTEVDEKVGDNADDTVEDKWPPVQGKGSSKPLNEFDSTLYVDQQSNIIVMVPFESSGAPTAAQRNLDLVASQPSVSEIQDQNL